METKNPIVFISYSWDSDEHHIWVKNLADRLSYEGIDIILDQYDLGYGQDTHLFMNAAIKEASKILLILTPKYKARTKMPGTGVWLEYSAMLPYFHLDLPFQESKFIPVLRHKVRVECTPEEIEHRLAFDLSGEKMDEAKFRQLLMAIKNIRIRPYTFDAKDLRKLTKPFAIQYRKTDESDNPMKENDLVKLMDIVKPLHPFHERLEYLPGLFRRWWMINPKVFRLAYKTQKNGSKTDNDSGPEVIGFTCIIPLSKKAYFEYKSGRLSEWEIGKFDDDIVKDSSEENNCYLLIQSLELSQKYWPIDTYVMAFNYSLLRHLARFNTDPINSRMVLIADGNTKGAELLKNRGFHLVVFDYDSIDRRPRYILDFNERYLSATAQTTVDNVTGYLSSFASHLHPGDQ